jgi:hypothetical protein
MKIEVLQIDGSEAVHCELDLAGAAPSKTEEYCNNIITSLKKVYPHIPIIVSCGVKVFT